MKKTCIFMVLLIISFFSISPMHVSGGVCPTWKDALREKCPNMEFFWSVFFRIRTEYGETLRISPYSVRMRKIRTRKNFQCILILFLNAEMSKIRRDKFSYLKILKRKIHLQIKQYRVLFESVCFHFEYL